MRDPWFLERIKKVKIDHVWCYDQKVDLDKYTQAKGFYSFNVYKYSMAAGILCEWVLSFKKAINGHTEINQRMFNPAQNYN